MRGTRRKLWILAMLVFASVSLHFGGDRILFATDRGSDFDVYKMANEGEPPAAAEVTDEYGDVASPSITPSGRDVIYEVNGVLYLNDVANPVGTPINLGNGRDPNVSPAYINTDRDYRVIYGYTHQSGISHIAMATIDISVDPLDLSDVVPMTFNPQQPQGGWDINHTEPAFCGDSHFVWVREDTYAHEICIQEFDATGPIGDKACYWSGLDDQNDDHHPSCSSDGLFMTWARGGPGYGAGSSDIWIMPCDGTDCDTAPGIAKKLYGTSFVETQPVWNPGDTWVAFAMQHENDDWEIFKIEVNVPGSEKKLTSNNDEDTAPSWGP